MSSHALAVARKDFENAGKSKMLWAMIGLLVVFSAVLYVAMWRFADDATAAEALGLLALPLQAILPIAALIVGYMAVVGERRSGSIKLLLGLPPNRTDVVVGKLLGRSVVVVAAVVAAFLVGALLSLAFFGSLPVADWLAFGLLTALFGLAFVGVAVGVSSSVSTRGRAMALAVGSYVVFVALWELLVAGTYYLRNDSRPPVEAETWYLFVNQFNPILAYTNLANEVVSVEIFPLLFNYGLRDPEAVPMTAAERYAGEAPFYLQEWFGIVVLLCWFVVPVLIGHYRFRRADL